MSETSLDSAHLAAITWSRITEGGDIAAVRWVRKHGYEKALALLRANSPQLPPAGAAWKIRLQNLTDFSPAALEKLGIKVLIPGDKYWPAQLADLGERCPLSLWVRGAENILKLPAVSVVGARACSHNGENIARDFAYELAEDFVIVSGGAFGIDAAAHQGALLAAGKTIILSAAGVDRVYPRSHAGLYEKVLLSGGAVVSESPLGATPQRFRFLLRNRIIAALGLATVVVEAGGRSGALNTARQALEIGREVGAVPGAPSAPMAQGCNDLIRNGGTLIYQPAQVKALIDPFGQGILPLTTGKESESGFGVVPLEKAWDEVTARIYDAVPQRYPGAAEKIANSVGCPVVEAQIKLSKLALSGHINKCGNLWVKNLH